MKCTAHLRDGSGKPCRKNAKKGMNVCASHGGAAPQTVRAAKIRLIEAVDPLLAELIRIGLSGKDERTRVAAINSALDRAGIDEPKRVEITHITEDLLDAEIIRLEAELADNDTRKS